MRYVADVSCRGPLRPPRSIRALVSEWPALGDPDPIRRPGVATASPTARLPASLLVPHRGRLRLRRPQRHLHPRRPIAARPRRRRWHRQGDLDVVAKMGILILAASILRGLAAFAQGYLAESSAQGVSYQLRKALYAHVQRLSFSFHDQAQTGELMARATADVEAVRAFTGRGLTQIAIMLLLLVGVAIALFQMNWPLAILSMLLLPAVAWRAYTFGRQIRPMHRAVQQEIATLANRIQESRLRHPGRQGVRPGRLRDRALRQAERPPLPAVRRRRPRHRPQRPLPRSPLQRLHPADALGRRHPGRLGQPDLRRARRVLRLPAPARAADPPRRLADDDGRPSLRLRRAHLRDPRLARHRRRPRRRHRPAAARRICRVSTTSPARTIPAARSSSTSPSAPSPARPSRWSARPARARPRSPT